jgi:glycosyltransferase involved in cell wall biosynthesis
MANCKRISLVSPMFNEGESIDFFYKTLCELFNRAPHLEFQVICVDDGSTDNSLEKLITIASQDARFQILELSRNFGKEAALTAGIDYATGDAVIPIDADLQDPPQLILEMIGIWQDGAEVILARRTNRSVDSFLKRKSASLFYSLYNCIAATKIPDNVGDFRLMDRVVVDAIKALPERNRFMKGLFAWVGFKTYTLDYARESRFAGSTKFSGWRLWNFAIEGITSFSDLPLRLWMYMGFFCACITFFYALGIVIKTLVWGVDTPGYASLIVAMLFFGSLQLIGIGILGEYIGRIYTETKCRPLYLVRKTYSSNNANQT